MRFRKIKWDGKKVLIQWERVDGDDIVESRLTSTDAPRKRFTNALDALIPEVLILIDAPADWSETMRCVGVSINYEDDERRGVVVTCLRELGATNAPLVINTPHLREQVEDIEEGAFLPDQILKILPRIDQAARKYLDGDRMQTELPLDATG